MRLTKWPNMLSPKSPDRKTIQGWEQQFGIFILDLDGFDKTDPRLYEKLFTQSEFEQAAAECTIIERKTSTVSSQEGDRLTSFSHAKTKSALPFNEAMKSKNQPDKSQSQKGKPSRKLPRAGSAKKATVMPTDVRRRRKNWSKRPLLWLIVMFTFPTISIIGLNWVYQKLQSRWKIPWYVPASILGLDLFILLIQPISPFISGPFFLWYLVLNQVSTLLHGVVTFIKVTVLHQPPGLTSAAPVPFLSSVSLAGNSVPLYFSMGSALTSSVFLATVISFGRDTLHRLFTLRKT